MNENNVDGFGREAQPDAGQGAQSGYGQPKAAKKSLGAQKRKILMIAGVAVVAIIFIVVMVKAIGSLGRGASSLEALGEDIVEAYEKEDAGRLTKLVHKDWCAVVTEDEDKDSYDDVEDLMKDTIKNDIEKMEDEVGEIKSIKITDMDTFGYSDNEVSGVVSQCKKYNDNLKADDFSRVYLRTTVNGKDSEKPGYIEFLAVQIGNKWYLKRLYTSLY